MSTMTDRLTERFEGDGFTFAHPVASSIEVDPEPAALQSIVIADAEQPVLIAATVEESPLATPALQVPGLLGELLRKYEAAEITYGEGDPRQALLVAARIDGPRIVTVQVHFPPSTADRNRPVAVAILDSLTITP